MEGYSKSGRGGRSSSWEGDDQSPGLTAVFLLEEDGICAGVVSAESGDVWQRSNGCLRKRKGEEYSSKL